MTSKILRALAVSTFLNAIYLATLGDRLLSPIKSTSVGDLEKTISPRAAGLWALLLLFIVPFTLGLLDYWRTRWAWVSKVRAKTPVLQSPYDPTPRGWDFAFSNRPPGFIRVLTGDGRWVGGWFGTDSFAASYPEPRELYIEKAWRLTKTGEFIEEVELGAGLFVRCDDVRVVEFLAPLEDSSGS